MEYPIESGEGRRMGMCGDGVVTPAELRARAKDLRREAMECIRQADDIEATMIAWRARCAGRKEQR